MKKILSCFLCSAMILGITGCSESGNANVTTREEITVDFSGVEIDVGKEVDIKGKSFKYLGIYDITNEGADPVYQYYKENYGADIEVIITSGDIMEKLSTMINSGESPDLIDQQGNSFPYYIGKNVYSALDDYMDLNAPQWKDVASYINNFAINGKHYYYPFAYYVSPNFLIYNRAKFKELAIDDPKELFEQNNWTWDTMAKCMTDFVNAVKGDDPYALGVYGYMNTSFIDSTGVPLVDFIDGQLVSNLNDPNVDRAQTFLENLKKQGLSNRYYDDGSFDHISELAVVEGNAAFQAMGDWKIGGYCAKMAEDDTLDFFFVPYPRDPQADKYYHKLETFGSMVPAGAPNIEAATVYMNCVRIARLDEKFIKINKTNKMHYDHFTEEQYDFWYYFQNSENFDADQLVYDYAHNIDQDTLDKVISKICDDVPFADDENTESWTVMRSSMEPLLNNSLSEINATLK